MQCNKNNRKNTWKLINSLTCHSSISKHIYEIEVDDQTFRDDKNISEAFKVAPYSYNASDHVLFESLLFLFRESSGVET